MKVRFAIIHTNETRNLQSEIGLKGFGWYTKEAMENLMEIWVENIENHAA